MIVLNTTFHVHISADACFHNWVTTKYLPNGKKADLVSPSFLRLMINVQEECNSYAISFKAATIEDAINWHDGEGADMRNELCKKYGDKILFFTTYMDELSIE